MHIECDMSGLQSPLVPSTTFKDMDETRSRVCVTSLWGGEGFHLNGPPVRMLMRFNEPQLNIMT